MYKSLLVAVDHSEITERVLGAACEMASLSQSEVWVLHLREREIMPKAGLMARESPDEAQATVDAAVEELTAAGITARGEATDMVDLPGGNCGRRRCVDPVSAGWPRSTCRLTHSRSTSGSPATWRDVPVDVPRYDRFAPVRQLCPDPASADPAARSWLAPSFEP